MIRNAYVYGIEVAGVLRYVGKGSGIPMKRAREHLRRLKRLLRGEVIAEATAFHRKLAAAARDGAAVEAVELRCGLSEHEAYSLEADLVASIPGLWNCVGGGVGGWKPSEETRRRQSEAARRRAATPEGRAHLEQVSRLAHTEEFRKRSSERGRQRMADPAERARLAEQARNRWRDPALAERMRVGLAKGRGTRKGKPGKKRTAENHARHVEMMRRMWADPDFQARMWNARRVAQREREC